MWKADDTGFAVDQWVRDRLSPIQGIILYLQSRIAISPRSVNRLNLSWILPPQRMIRRWPSFTHDEGTDDVHLAGYPEGITGGHEDRSTGTDVDPELRPDGSRGERGDTEYGEAVARERPDLGTLRLNRLVQSISHRLNILGRNPPDRGHEPGFPDRITSLIHGQQEHEVLPVDEDLAFRAVSGPDDTADASHDEGIPKYDLSEPYPEAGEKRQSPPSTDIARILLDKAQRIINLTTVRGHRGRREEGIESSWEMPPTAPSQEEIRAPSIPRMPGLLHGPNLSESVGFAADRSRSAMMDEDSPNVAKRADAGDYGAQTSAPGHRTSQAEETSVSEQTRPVEGMPSRAAFGETDRLTFPDVVHRYRIPARQMSVMPQEGPRIPHAEDIVRVHVEREMPDAAGRSLPRGPRPFLPGLLVAARPPLGFLKPAMIGPRLTGHPRTPDPPYGEDFAFAGVSSIQGYPSGSVPEDYGWPFSLSPAREEEDYVSDATQSPVWEYPTPPPRSLDYAREFSRAQAAHRKPGASGGDLPHAVLAGATHQTGANDSAGIAMARLDRSTAGGSSTALAPSDTMPAAASDKGGASSMDIDSLAQDVYQIIKRRLACEKERRAFAG
jgi:hypothetical protein